jgi:hypothetical protein
MGGVSASLSYTGGITGRDGNVRNSYNLATINGASYTAGICGYRCHVINSYNLGDVNGTSYVSGLQGTIGSAATSTNSFSMGTIKGTSYVYGTIGSVTGGTWTNVYWYDSNFLDNASTCYSVVDANCTRLTDANYTVLFDPATDLYDTNLPTWDTNWVWSGTAYPKLAWQN